MIVAEQHNGISTPVAEQLLQNVVGREGVKENREGEKIENIERGT